MNYLVTGGAGVIGSNIARRLVAEGHAVTVIDSCDEPRNEWIASRLPKDVTLLRGNIEDHYKHLCEILGEADAVIHCAASTGIPYSVGNPSDDWRRNVDATKVLLDALRSNPVPTVALSSIKPYRVEPMPAHGLAEDAILDPDEPYAASKAAQSMLCLAYAHSYGIPVTVFRCSNLYGPAPCHGPRHGWLTWFCISAAIGRPIEVQGSGNQTRDMLHSDDVYSACMAALGKIDRTTGRVFNLGGGEANRISVNSAANILHHATGVDVEFTKPRAMDDLHVFVDHTAFTMATGWEPKVNVRDGLDSVLTWAKAHSLELAALYRDVQ